MRTASVCLETCCTASSFELLTLGYLHPQTGLSISADLELFLSLVMVLLYFAIARLLWFCRTQDMQGDPFGLLLRQRIVFMGGEVNDFMADAIISQLLLLDAQDPSKVTQTRCCKVTHRRKLLIFS